jgi:ABC-type antimicrobial peptide transport system permease subunit
VIAALLVEPVVAAVLGALAGVTLAIITGFVLDAMGFVPTGVGVSGLLLGSAIATGVSIVAAVATSIVPTWNAASRPPIRSLSSGG